MIIISIKTPKKQATAKLAIRAVKKEPVQLKTRAAAKAPIMYRDPWARFINPITPKIRVKPADIKKSVTPN